MYIYKIFKYYWIKIYCYKSSEERDGNIVFVIPIIDLKCIHINHSYTNYCKYLEKSSFFEFAFQSGTATLQDYCNALFVLRQYPLTPYLS